jgi:hypothetical protein
VRLRASSKRPPYEKPRADAGTRTPDPFITRSERLAICAGRITISAAVAEGSHGRRRSLQVPWRRLRLPSGFHCERGSSEVVALLLHPHCGGDPRVVVECCKSSGPGVWGDALADARKLRKAGARSPCSYPTYGVATTPLGRGGNPAVVSGGQLSQRRRACQVARPHSIENGDHR